VVLKTDIIVIAFILYISSPMTEVN
jgi:hypothetical protein